jgi:hypothetical protein
MKTGWKSRNRHLIREAVLEAEKRGVRSPTLIDIAPGLVTRLVAPYFPFPENYWTRWLALVDGALRKTGRFPSVCFEIDEILEISTRLEPTHVYVLYADPEVEKVIPESDLIVLNPTDLNNDRLLELGDIVFCYNTIQETANPKGALENILRSVKVGGLLSIDSATDWRLDPRTDPMFLRISDNLYVKEF